MNLGLITSYVIAGIILLAILSMNMSVSSSSNEITLTQITRDRAASISDMLSNDVQKMGYNRKKTTDPILTVAEGNKIQFRSNIDNSTDNSVEIITWEFTNTAASNTKNPNDKVLMRTVRDASSGSLISQTPIKSGVTKFRISYYEKYGAARKDSVSTPLSSSEMGNVKQLYISLELQSHEKIYKSSGGSGRYVTSVWEKRFSPPNLEF